MTCLVAYCVVPLLVLCTSIASLNHMLQDRPAFTAAGALKATSADDKENVGVELVSCGTHWERLLQPGIFWEKL